MKKKLITFLAVITVICCVFGIVGCKRPNYTKEPTNDKSVYSVGDKCPDITLKTYLNNEISIANSEKVTVLYFWYTTCDPCIVKLPYFEKVRAEFGDEIMMVAIHSSTAMPKNGAEGVRNFIAGKGWNEYGIIFTNDTSELNCYEKFGGEGAYPLTVIINKDGYIEYLTDGHVTENELRNEISELL